jgi:hypothetical protein
MTQTFKQKYSKMFDKVANIETAQLQEMYAVLSVSKMNPELSCTKAVIGEALIERMGESEFYMFDDTIHAAA